MSVTMFFCLAQSYPINDGCMIQFIRENSILFGEQGFKYSGISIKTAWIKNSVLTLVKVGNFMFQFLWVSLIKVVSGM
jgi:uncharacterized membrane protein YobD (UPF0266 family)